MLPSHIGSQIDCSTDGVTGALGQDPALSAQKTTRNIGKVQLLTMSYCPTEGAKLLPMSDGMVEIFVMGVKEMAESFNNIVHSQSETQADSLDAVNRQTAVPDWRFTP